MLIYLIILKMNLSKLKLPSNKKFGFFFSAIFFIIFIYLYFKDVLYISFFFGFLAFLFLSLTLLKAELLLPLNKFWMTIGLVLSLIINPIIMGLIFFFLFTPMAIVMRIVGRDELRLRFNNKSSHWLSRKEASKIDSFRNQF